MSNGATRSGGIGLGGLLTVLFTYLKLTNQIDWSWWWVTSPIWIPISVVLSLIVIALIGSLTVALLKK